MKEQQDEQQNLVEKKSIVQDLMDHQHLSIEERIARYYHLKSTEFENYNFDMEDKLNLHGYDLLWAGKTEEALAIFQLVVDEFPESANAYDSLGEAHLALGNMDLALENYEKTLALNPNNFFAEDQIERIKVPNKKQLTAEEKFALVLPKEEYFADLDQLSQDLKTMHPFVFKFITEADFDALVLDGKSQIDEDYTVG
ncbi:MAG: tetratricopeptide repeat protein, partial [Flavobacteriales bacterium]|nr:tetratricopeptide repeat protein [Flavobacteriales bacterium]